MAIQKNFADNAVDTSFVQAPARVIARTSAIEQVIIVVNGSKEDECILPHALNFARERNAELVLIHTYKAGMSGQAMNRAELYLRTLRNKVRSQYSNTIAFLHRGMDVIAALEFVIDDNKSTCVMLPARKDNWLQRLWRVDIADELENLRPALTIRDVKL